MRPSLPRRRRRTVRRPGSRDLPPRTALRTAPQARPGARRKPAQLGQVSQSRGRAPAGRRRPGALSRCERAGRRRAALEHHAARRTGRHRPARCAVGPCVTPRSTAVPLEAGESARGRRWGCAAVQMWGRHAQHAPGAAGEPGRAGAQAAPLQVGMAFGPRRAEANCSVTRRDILRFLHGLNVSDDDIRCAPRRRWQTNASALPGPYYAMLRSEADVQEAVSRNGSWLVRACPGACPPRRPGRRPRPCRGRGGARQRARPHRPCALQPCRDGGPPPGAAARGAPRAAWRAAGRRERGRCTGGPSAARAVPRGRAACP